MYNEDEYKTVYESGYEDYEDDEIEIIEEDVRQKNWKKTIVSKTAYLLGLDKKFLLDAKKFEPSVYTEMDSNRAAIIIRNLCILRSSIIKKSGDIYRRMTYDLKSLYSLPEYIPINSLDELRESGIDIARTTKRVNDYIIDINNHIRNRINNCKNLYPSWINWDYIKDLFLMPGGDKEISVISECKLYKTNYYDYPFHLYLNWPGSECGTILFNDGIFLKALYEAHEDSFQDISKVRDASTETKTSIYDYLENCQKTALLVDCENSDPYKLYAVLKNLDTKSLLKKITAIYLFDDFHTTDTWKILSEFTVIPVNYWQVDRVKMNKSLVDQTLIMTATKLVYTEQFDSFILAASDSDYWPLISGLNDTKFLIMIEYEKCGPDIKAALEENGTYYCYMDDFCTGAISDIKLRAFFKEFRKELDSLVDINIYELIDSSITQTRMKLTPDEKEAYLQRIRKNLKISLADDGNVKLIVQ